jgi:phage tail sheath protein FI
MVQVSFPGVYILEVPSGVRPITGVSTSIAAFFGRTAKGPINRAVRILSRADFVRVFGGADPRSELAASLNKFFENGGQDCYVVRIAHNPQAADVTLRNRTNTTDVLVATARDAGAWGNGLRLEVDYNTANPEETFNLRVIHYDSDTEVARETHTALTMDPTAPRFAPAFVTQSSNSITLELAAGFDPTTAVSPAGYSESRRPFATNGDALTTMNALVHPGVGTPLSNFEISVNDSPYRPINLRLNPASVAFTSFNDVATQFQTRINDQLAGTGLAVAVAWVVSGGLRVLRITADAGSDTSARVRRAAVNDLAGPIMLGVEQGGIESVRLNEFRPAPTGTFLQGDLNVLANLAQNAFNRVTIATTNVDIVDSGTGTSLLEVTGPQPRPWFEDALPSAVNGHNDGVREKLAIIAGEINKVPPSTTGPSFRAEVWGYRLAVIPTNLTSNTQLDLATSLMGGGGTNIGTAGAPQLFTRNVRQYSLGATGVGPFQVPGLNGRDDDGSPLDVPDFTGVELDHTGFFALDLVDIFNLMVLPGDTDISEGQFEQIIGPASIYCEQKRAFLLLDAPDSWTTNGRPANDITTRVNSLRNLVVKKNSAVFYPRIIFSDAGRRREMGASGAIAGIMARIDSTRGVWKAPAGLEADVRAILDLDVNLTDKENGVLNKLAANSLRKFPNGIVNWGARTLDGSDDNPSENKYIPVRRLTLFLEESLFRGTKWVVFEPNDEPLYALIRKNLRAFMLSLFRQGAFQGTTPDQAFYVKCDGETTTANDRNLGIVNIEVGFAPLKPAEFVIIKIQQIAEQTE